MPIVDTDTVALSAAEGSPLERGVGLHHPGNRHGSALAGAHNFDQLWNE